MNKQVREVWNCSVSHKVIALGTFWVFAKPAIDGTSLLMPSIGSNEGRGDGLLVPYIALLAFALSKHLFSAAHNGCHLDGSSFTFGVEEGTTAMTLPMGPNNL